MRTPEEIAKSCIVYRTGSDNVVNVGLTENVIAAAITARDTEWRAKFAAFIDEKGEPIKTVGVVPSINGVVVGAFTTVFAVDPISGEITELRTRFPSLVGTTSLGPLPEYHDWGSLHLTRESAESAQAATARRGEG